MIPGYRMYYPFKSHYFTIANGHLMHYLDEGHGDPIVMVEGIPTWAFYYRYQEKAVRDEYRAVVPDHIGMGLSQKPQDAYYTYTLKSRIDDLEALLEHTGVTQDITLVVHDWGGPIGFGYAIRHPERIKRLMILNTSAFHLLPGKDVPLPLTFFGRTLVGAYLTRSLNAFARGAALFATSSDLPAAIADAYTAPYDSWDNRIGTIRFVQDIPTKPSHPAYPVLSEIQEAVEGGLFANVPALICWGMQDFVFDADYLAKWEAALPEAEVHRFPDAGHYVLEDATKPIADLFIDWLERTPID
ncbi:MAG: alpha/beta fold hydrolase [Anaerolineae bacterium]